MAATTKDRLDRHDRQIAAIRGLIQEGMRLGVETRKDLRVIAGMQKKTDEMQKRTEAKLEALIDSMTRGGNGHAKRRLDVK
jgi:hypothetical protein